MRKFVSWRRVSTKAQGKSGLGLEAQASIIEHFVKMEQGELIKDFHEVYTGKDLDGCVELQKAMRFCKENGATLIIAKTDRFRSTKEALDIYDKMKGQIYFCDLPHTDKFTLTLFFALAEREATIISIRTKQALAAKKARGCKLGRTSGADVREMCAASAVSRREKARNNPTNKIIWGVLSQYTDGGKRMPSTDEYERVCLTLSGMGVTTSTGLPFNVSRARNAYHNLKRIFDGYHGLRFNVSKLCY